MLYIQVLPYADMHQMLISPIDFLLSYRKPHFKYTLLCRSTAKCHHLVSPCVGEHVRSVAMEMINFTLINAPDLGTRLTKHQPSFLLILF